MRRSNMESHRSHWRALRRNESFDHGAVAIQLGRATPAQSRDNWFSHCLVGCARGRFLCCPNCLSINPFAHACADTPAPVPASLRLAATPMGVASTNVTLSHELDRLGEPKFAPTHFKASTHEPAQNAQFRIGVDRQGAVVYCFRLLSSGDAVLD